MGTSKDELVDDSETESYDAEAKESDTEEADDDEGDGDGGRNYARIQRGKRCLLSTASRFTKPGPYPFPFPADDYQTEPRCHILGNKRVHFAQLVLRYLLQGAMLRTNIFPWVRKIEYRLKEWRYFLHYLGWNKNWDEWVLGSRLMKYTDENVEKYVTNGSKHGLEKNARPGRPALLKAVPRGRKRKMDTSMKETGALSSGKLVSIRLPAVLKKQLIDDCEFITHLGKLVKLPRVPNVDDITKKYLNYRMKKDGSVANSVGEIIKGLQCYFDKALPIMLLYKTERQQYEQANADNVPPSMIYGAEHLLRLFVKLPELLLHANIEEETLAELHQKLTEFLKFLQKNQSTFFMSSYHSPELSETSKNCPVG